jgi:hypothetical protein
MESMKNKSWPRLAAEVMAHHRGKAKTVATMLATMMALPNQEGLVG